MTVKPMCPYVQGLGDHAGELGFVVEFDRANNHFHVIWDDGGDDWLPGNQFRVLIETRTAHRLLSAAHGYIHHFVPVGSAEIDGFDVEAWCAAVEGLLGPDPSSCPHGRGSPPASSRYRKQLRGQ